jgi:hypothetical protein
MADKKISALTAASTPLAGTEVLPVVQSGSTVKVSVANLTAGRTVQMTGINDANNNPLFKFTSTASAVNEVTYANAAAGGSPSFSATGSDTNISIALTPKGSGRILVTAGSFQINTGEFSLGSGGANGFVSGNTWYGINTGNWVFQAGNGSQSFVWANSSGTSQVTLASNTGNVTLNTGNLVQGTAAKGINFTANTPAAGMTSQLLNWYEEGTWTPNFTNCGTASATSAQYTRIGRLVTIHLTMTATNVVANSSQFTLPFASAQITAGVWTRGTVEGGFVEVQASTACYFASTPATVPGTYYVTATYRV